MANTKRSKPTKPAIVEPTAPLVYTIHDRKFIMGFDPDNCTGTQFDLCNEVAVAIENSVINDDGTLSLIGILSSDWCKFLSAILINEKAEKWTADEGLELRKWLDEHFPNPNLLGEIVQNFFDANAGWLGGSRLLSKLKSQVLAKGRELIAKRPFPNPQQKLKPIETPN